MYNKPSGYESVDIFRRLNKWFYGKAHLAMEHIYFKTKYGGT